MTEEKNNQNKKKEKCPLCNISEDTLERLKRGGSKEGDDKLDKNGDKTKDGK